MLKRLTSDLEEVYSSVRPILSAMRELAAADSPEAIIDTLRERIVGDDVERVTIVQIGIGPSGEAVTEALAVSDYRGIASDDDLPIPIRKQLDRKPLIVSDIGADRTASKEVVAYTRNVIRASSLLILPLTARNRTVGYLTIATNRARSYAHTEIQTLEALASQIATVLDTLSLHREMTHQTQTSDLMMAISRALAGTLELDAVGANTASGLAAAYPINHLSVALVSEDDPAVQILTFEGKALPAQMDLKGTLLEKAMNTRQTIIKTDTLDSADAGLWQKADVATLIIAPMKIRDRVLGTLNVGLDKSAHSMSIDLALFEHLAGQIGLVHENARMVERFQQALAETTLVYSTSLALSAAQSLEEAYETAISELAHLNSAHRIYLYIAGPDPHGEAHYLEQVAVWEDQQVQASTIGQHFSFDETPILGQFLFSRANLIFNDLSSDARLSEDVRTSLREQGVHSAMMIPVSTGATWIGAFIIENRSETPFSSEQARMSRSVADQAALVIGSQILLARARQATAREHALVNTSAALSSSLNPEYLLNSVLDNLQEIIPHDAANILTIEEGEARTLVARGYAAKGVDEEALFNLRIPPDAVDNLKTMRDERRPVVITRTADYKDWVETPETTWVNSYVGAPIFVGDNLIGFLNLDSSVPGFFTQEDANLLQAFADQFGVAYQNAQLFQKSRLRAQREQILGDIAGKLQTVSSMDDVLETATRSIQALLGEYDVALRLNVPEPEPDRQYLTGAGEGEGGRD